jgi:ABC-type multidrug transport system permease subunit
MFRHVALAQLMVAGIKSFLREPEAIFWTYGFPILMVIGLGIAFNSSGQTELMVDVVRKPDLPEIVSVLEQAPGVRIRESSLEDGLKRLRLNKTQVVLTVDSAGVFEYHFDPSNPDSRVARDTLDNILQSAAGRADPLKAEDRTVTAPGSRYVDFLVPGLIGMNLMGGGLWGVGFVLVDMRIKKLLKRMLATPMPRSHFLLSAVGTRIIFFIPEAFALLLAAHWIFGVPIEGSILSIVLVAFVGAMSFAGLGLLAASRAQRVETVSGIMNVIMLPMWLCSGIFFSSERFPEVMQPFIQALPLTQLINALRAVILEGQAWTGQLIPLLVLIAWGGLSFTLAYKWFRWN